VAARPEVTEFRPSVTVQDIFFDFDEAEIRPGDAQVLDTNVDWLLSNSNYLVLIEGHCDERGTNAYNLALGDRRARVTRNYFVSRGVSAHRITTLSWGEERPFCTDRTEECWAKNRRAHLLVKPATP
jgi:peptidoglycan-associated lipoprotein